MAFDINLIGNENLPNLYISSIEIHPGTQTRNTITKNSETVNLSINFCFFNSIGISGRPYYYSNDKIDQIKVFISTDTDVTEELRSKSVVLEKNKISKFIEKSKNKFLEITLDKNDYGKFLKYNKLKKINKSLKIEKISTNGHLALFACLSRKHSKTEEFGPTILEMVLDNNEVPMNTSLFLKKNTTKIWPGQVHQHPSKGYMENSFHSDSVTHGFLDTVNVYNLKTKDYRFNFFTNQPLVSTERVDNRKVFSPLEVTKLEDGRIAAIFSINAKEILRQNSKQANILSSIYPELIDKFEDVNIRKLDIVANKRSILSTKSVGDKIRYSESRIGKVKNLKLSEERYIYSGECVLNFRKLTSIRITAETNDPIKSYLTDLAGRVSSFSLSYLKNFSSLLTKEIYYDKESGNYNRKNLVNTFDKNNPKWSTCVKTLLEAILVVYGKSATPEDQIIRNFTSMISPKTCTIESIIVAGKICSSILSKMVKMYDISRSRNSFSFGRSPKRSRKTFPISSKIFHLTIKHNKKYKNYLKNNSSNMFVNTYNAGQFIRIMEREKRRFSNEDFILTNDQTRFVEHATFSPAEIVKGDDKFILKNLSTINEEKLGKFADSLLLNESQLSKLFGSNIRAERFREKYDFEDNLLSDDTNVFDEPEEKLLDDRKKRRAPLKNMIEKARKFSSNSSRFSIFNKSSKVIENKTPSQYSKLPIQHVFLLNPDVALPVVGELQSFFFEKQYTKDAMFFNLQRIKYYSISSNNGIGNKQYRDLTIDVLSNLNNPIVCRMFDYYDPDFNSPSNQFEDYNVVNKIFVIYPNNYNAFSSVRPDSNPLRIKSFSSFYRIYNLQDFYEYELSKNVFFVENESRKQTVLGNLMKKSEPVKKSILLKQTKKINKKRKKSKREKISKTNKNKLNLMLKKTKVPDLIEDKESFLNNLKPKNRLSNEKPKFSSSNEIPEVNDEETMQETSTTTMTTSFTPINPETNNRSSTRRRRGSSRSSGRRRSGARSSSNTRRSGARSPSNTTRRGGGSSSGSTTRRGGGY